ncbi:MAG TPA: transcription termination/antitermination protein NusA, partial [Cyanobacteria bacterium UBA11369]|nr:transcription termination/antitermination protein NusA [Cyanobacteria bacterium UBA11369]
VRLAARLTGWKIDIKDAAKYDAAAEDEKIAAEIASQVAQKGANDAEEEFDEDPDSRSSAADWELEDEADPSEESDET